MAKKYDPFLLDETEVKKQEETLKGKSTGLICPRKHNLGSCAVCDKVKKLWEDGSEESKAVARQKGVKTTYIINAVFPDNPKKNVLIELGKKAGDAIIYGAQHGWKDIVHPKKGIGREMQVTKTKGDSGYNTYITTPNLEKADYDIPEKVINNLYNLDNVLELINTEDIFKVSSIKMDETISFRICPHWDENRYRSLPIAPLWKHWGVSQAEIDGEEELQTSEEEEETKFETDSTPEFTQPRAKKPKGKDVKPACFADVDCYDPDDEECAEKCVFFADCGAAVEEDDTPF